MKNQIFKKVCAVITSFCFMSMVISPNVFAAVNTDTPKMLDGITAPETETSIPLNNVQDSIISSSFGKIIDVNNKNSDTLVINIQDLHCDYSVQKNIYNIIDELCEKYNIENIYAEGGIGTADFGILGDINPAYKKTILENLLKSGRLTGAEYYTVLNNKQGFLKGVENEKSYKKNIVRLSEILKAKRNNDKYLSNIDREVAFFKAKYLTSKNKNFSNLLDKYENKKISRKEFLSKLFAVAADNGINTKKYENLQNAFSLALSSSDINKKSLSKEFAAVISEIKKNVSYNEYNKIISSTAKFSNFSAAKTVIENYCSAKKINIAKVYPNLNKFLSLKKDSLSVNPVAMVKEERKLIDTIRTYLSETPTELEIAYISDFKDFYKKYISAELSSSQWEYVKLGLEKFEELYAKYSVQNDVANLKMYSRLLTDFYNVNTERNSIFLSNMGILKTPVIASASSTLSSRTERSEREISSVQPRSGVVAVNSSDIPSLFSAKKIMILVSGGYHTEGITELLNKNNISNITITPEVINASAATRSVYENLVLHQAMSVRQMIALGLISNASSKEQISAVINSMFPNQNLDTINVNMLATHLNQVFAQNVSVSVLPDGKTLKFSFSDGTEQTIDITEDIAKVVEQQNISSLSAEQLKPVTEDKLKDMVSLIAKTSFNYGQDIFAPQIYQIAKDICVFTVDKKWYLGNGAVWDIAVSQYDGKTLDGVEPVIYEYMPEIMQKGLMAKEEKNQSLKTAPLMTTHLKNLASRFFLFVMAMVLTLSMTACSVFDKKGINEQPSQIVSVIEQTSKSDVVLNEEYRTFNDKISGYLQTFYSGNGKYNSFTYRNMDENKVFVNNTAASIQNLYDQALAALSLMQIGDREGAERILNTISSNGTFYKSNLERYQVTGEMIWVGIAAVQYKLLTGTTRYDSLIAEVDDYLDYVHKKDGSYYGQNGHIWVSTEHMLDAVAYLNLKSRYDGSEQIKQDLESAAAFIYSNLYDADKGGFVRGYKDEAYVLDTQAWGIQVLLALKDYNPEIYESSGLSNIDIDRLLAFAEQFKSTSVPEEYKNLYTWSLDAGSSVSFEWSMEMAVSYKLLGQEEKAQAILDDCIAYSKDLGAYSDYIVYCNKDGLLNYYPDGWEVHTVNALCTSVGQQTQIKYGISYFWFLKKIEGVDYSTEMTGMSNVNFIMEEDYNWRTYGTDKLVDLTDVTDITLKMKLKEIPTNFDPKIRIRFLPKNPNAIQNLTNIADFGVLRHDYTFDENGELVLKLNLDNDVWMELCGTTNKPRLKEVLMDYEHMQIIVIAGQYSFNYRLNDGKLDLDISIEFYDADGNPVTFFNDGTDSDNSILPSTFAKINNLIATGSASMFNILKTIIKEETWKSFLTPVSFVAEHPLTNKGAEKLSKITIFAQLMSIVLSVAVNIFLITTGIGFFSSLLITLGTFIISQIAALFVNVTSHAVMDFRFIRASGLREAVNLYGKERVSFNEDGTIFISQEKKPRVVSSLATPFPSLYSDVEYNRTTFVVTELPGNEKDFNFRPVKIKVKNEYGSYSRVWLGNYREVMVIYAPNIKPENLVSEIINSYDFTRLFGPRFKNDFVQIDMTNPDRELSYTQAGHIIVGENILKTGEYIDYRKEAALVANKKVDAVTINQNIAIFIDDSADTVSSPDDMVSLVNSFVKSDKLGTSAKILFYSSYIGKIINLLEQKLGSVDLAREEFLKIIKQLKDDNIEISVVFDDSSSSNLPILQASNLSNYGIFSYVVDGKYFDSVTSTETTVKMISDLNKIDSFDGSLSVLKISRFKDEIDETSGIFTFLNSAVNIKRIMEKRSVDFVKQAASNFDYAQIPEIPEQELIDIITSNQSVIASETASSVAIQRRSAVSDKFQLLNDYLDPLSQISIYYASLKPNEKEAFTEEILKRILAVNYMRQQGIQYGLRDHKLEVMLANALYQSVIAHTDTGSRRSSAEDLSSSSQLSADFKQSVVTMKASEAERTLNELLAVLSQQAFSNNNSDAIAAIIELIPLYADKNIVPFDTESVEFISDKSLVGLRSVLAAA